jgi:hypothetical protein
MKKSPVRLAQLEAGLPIIEDAVAARVSQLNAHIADTKTFGKKIGTRGDLLP